MPDQAVVIGKAPTHGAEFEPEIVSHEALHVDGGAIQIDAHGSEGTILIEHELGVTDILRAKDASTGITTVLLDKNAQVEANSGVFVSVTATNVSEIGRAHV